MRNVLNACGVGLACGLLIALVLSPFIGGAMWLTSASCHSTAHAMGLTATWGPLQDCIVQVQPGKFIPMKNLRTVDILK